MRRGCQELEKMKSHRLPCHQPNVRRQSSSSYCTVPILVFSHRRVTNVARDGKPRFHRESVKQVATINAVRQLNRFHLISEHLFTQRRLGRSIAFIIRVDYQNPMSSETLNLYGCMNMSHPIIDGIGQPNMRRRSTWTWLWLASFLHVTVYRSDRIMRNRIFTCQKKVVAIIACTPILSDHWVCTDREKTELEFSG